MKDWKDKRVLITGACGTVGRELLRQLVPAGPAEIVALDHNESELFFLNEAYERCDHVRFHLGDIRNREHMSRKMEGIDVVLHAAAYKHVILCEESPRDAIKTNIDGTQNIIDGALDNRVERVIFTSSDKAVNPTSVMGTSKLMGERLMTAANALRRDGRPIFASTRFGNVLGSRGSVIPIFRNQIRNGGPVSVTDQGMSRFIMTIEQAVALVLESTFLAKGGEVFVTKMPVVRIADLAEVMVEELAPRFGYDPGNVDIKVIGSKPGEKMYEELVNEEEVRRLLELDDYFVVTPAFKSVFNFVDYTYPGMRVPRYENPYNSAKVAPMSRSELKAFLNQKGLLEEPESKRPQVMAEVS